MVEHLPPDGAAARAANGHAWQQSDYTATDSRDLLALLLTAFLNANRDPDKQPAMPWPEPGWRPGDPLPEDAEAQAEQDRAQARTAFDHITAQVLPSKG
ncbi:hypothetical protein [Streptomyces sp. A13(2022)]|uniref:hypothetical protein n=1 Tax=Streptomyces sp. A13(2022) TaxID=2964768 RepID=UPI0021D9289F|nr:hypothetical protein [Streptomyces sp. A13(2022)]MCU8589920.1 hypothetical protein [Streptomyces sp. A13(2022)]